MESFWKIADVEIKGNEAVLYLDGSVLCDENTTIIIESDLDTEFSWVMDTGFTITKEKIYKTNKHTFLQRK